MTPQTIKTTNLNDFLELIKGLAERGLGFDADHSTLTITLNGAF